MADWRVGEGRKSARLFPPEIGKNESEEKGHYP